MHKSKGNRLSLSPRVGFILSSSLSLIVLLAGSSLLGQIRTGDRAKAAKSSPQAPGSKHTSSVQQAARLNNLGVAYMNQQKLDKALQLFEQAHALDPALFSAELNRGIALLNLQRFEPAKAVLLGAVGKRAASTPAWYNLGLLYRSQ